MKLNRMRGAIRPAILALLLGSTAAPAFAQSLIPALPIGEERILVAQNQQDTAQLLMRLQDLEEQVRNLTGRVEGLEFQLQQLLKQAQDNEFRFQELEGGAMGKPQAAAPTDGETPSDALPQTSATDVPVTANLDQLPADDGMPMDDIDGEPMHGDLGVGDSADPLLSGGLDQLGTLSDDPLSLDPGRPLDLSLSGTGEISSGDAIAQYQAGYDAMTRGDYAFAEDQFTQFVALYPTDPQVPDAINYLGEALIQRGAYTDAAQVLADGYTQHRESNRAPDIMLKLGVALVGAEQADVGCRTFYTLAQRYPNLSPAFQQRLAEEQQKAQCPVAN
ncbi:MAG: tol-pal system protein YbgF [Devosia sp.]